MMGLKWRSIQIDWKRLERSRMTNEEITDASWTARFFFHDGMMLTDRLRYGALRDGNDPRVTQLELLRPEIFVEYVAGKAAHDGDDETAERWRSRPQLEVTQDPRFIAHRCGFDHQMILHICCKTVEEAYQG